MTRVLVHGQAKFIKGGIETYVYNMANHMPDDIVFDYVLEERINRQAFSMPGKGDVLYVYPKRKLIANVISWYKLLKARKTENRIIYFNWYSMAWLFPAIIAKIEGYKVIIHAHNNDLHNCGIILRSMHMVNRHVQKYMNITRLTNSELSARFFFGEKPAEMIYNAIDIEQFAYNSHIREQIRRELDIETKRVYGFAGRIVYQKNPLFLMDIFKEIARIDPDAAFIVCGDGDLMSETQRKSRNAGINVLFLGAVNNIQDYYQAMDVFILPSRFEGLGIVLVEAQCSGLPCLTSDIVVPKEVNITGLVEFLPLLNNPNVWALEATKRSVNSRIKYKQIISETRFNILTESVILGGIIKRL